MLQRLRNRGEDAAEVTEVLERVAHTPPDPVTTDPEGQPRPEPHSEASPAGRGRQPWRLRLRKVLGTITRPAVAAGMLVFGSATLIVAWLGVSGQTDVTQQLIWFVGAGIPGLAFVLLGGIWIADHEVDRATIRLDRFERDVTRLHRAIVGADQAPAPVPGTARPYPVTPSAAVVVVPHGETYHRANCLVIRGKADPQRYERDAIPEGRSPCVVCAPDGPEG